MDYNSTDIYFPPHVLKKLVTDKYSAVKVIKDYHGHLELLPFHLGFLKDAISSQLQAKVGHYDHRMDGVILGFTKVKVIDSPGLSDSPDIVLAYKADVYVFSPTVGQVIKGVVNQVSKEHVGVLVHGAFNASLSEVHSHRLRRLGDRPDLGTTVEFTISRIKFTDHLIAIEGPLPIMDDDKILSTEDEGEKTDVEGMPSERVSALEEAIPEPSPSPKEKKKKRKKLSFEKEENSENIGWDSGIASGAEPCEVSPLRLGGDRSIVMHSSQEEPSKEKKVKKKRKSKDLSKEKYEDQNSSSCVKEGLVQQIETEQKKDKKKRKRESGHIKEEPLSDVEPTGGSFNSYEQPPSSPIKQEGAVKEKKHKSKKKRSLENAIDNNYNTQLEMEPPVRIKEEPVTPKPTPRKRKCEDVPHIKLEPLSDVETIAEPKKKRRRYEESTNELSVPEKKQKKKKSFNMDAVSEQLMVERRQSLSL